MNFWYCESCASIRGPRPSNICPACGSAMWFAREADAPYRPAIGDEAVTHEDGQRLEQFSGVIVDIGSDIPGGGAA